MTETTTTEDPIQKLKEYQEHLDTHIAALRGYATALAAHELHFLPNMQPTTEGTQIVVQIMNFKEDGSNGTTMMEGVPAAFFYEAYREALPGILAEAAEKATGSLAVRAADLKTSIEDQKKKLTTASRELDQYLKPPKAPKAGKKA